MTVTIDTIRDAARSLALSGRPLCVHASLRSFGWVDGGAPAVVDGLLAEGCTVLVPTFTYAFAVEPLPHQRPARNGWNYAAPPHGFSGAGLIYTTGSMDVERGDMGAIPAAVAAMSGRARGDHPLCSFSAVGPWHRTSSQNRRRSGFSRRWRRSQNEAARWSSWASDLTG